MSNLHWTRLPLLHSLTFVALHCIMFASQSQAQQFFIGGYGDGLYSSTLQADGKMTEPKRVVRQPKPAFFAFHPKLDVLYCVTESDRKDSSAPVAVAAYRVERHSDSPGLTLLNVQSVNGDAPCHVSVDGTGTLLAIANYSSGTSMLYPLDKDGRLMEVSSTIQYEGSGPNKARQESAHAHCGAWDLSNKFLLVADLGTDQVMVHEVDHGNKVLKPATNNLKLAPGSGPRHLSFHPNGKLVFIINELNSTLTSASWDASKGILKEIQTLSTLPAGAKSPDYSTAEVLVHPSGKYVYGSNRGHHTIAGFRLDEASGKLNAIGHTPTGGKTPRNFRISPDGAFLLAENQDSNSVHSFRIDANSGDLTATGFSIQAPLPACIKFLPR